MKIRKMFPLLLIAFFIIPYVSAASESITASYVSVIFGIFSSLTFIIVSYYSLRNQQSVGPWILLGLACILLTMSEYFKAFTDVSYQQTLMTAGMGLIFFVALFKFWDTMEIMQ